jgi:hypothetical protein
MVLTGQTQTLASREKGTDMCNCKGHVHSFKCAVRNIFDVFVPGKG